jgi:ABC-type lipoprotein release transport system permease subunit
VQAVRLVYRAELRRRWQSWIALGLLVSIAGGTVLGALVAGQRTSAAFPAFVAHYGYDTLVFTGTPEPMMASLPEVAAIDELPLFQNGNLSLGDKVAPAGDVSVLELAATSPFPPMKLLAGTLPAASQPNGVLVSFAFAQQFGVHIGSVVAVPFYSPAQSEAILNSDVSGTIPTRGPTVHLAVVGIEANLIDFPSGSPTFTLFVGPAFGRDESSHVLAFSVAFARLRGGPEEQALFNAAVHRLVPSGAVEAENVLPSNAAVEHAIEPQAIGWDLLGVLAALAALAVIAQALAREARSQAESYPTLRALGLRPQELFRLGVLTAASVGLLGAIGAVGLGWALSPLTPVGDARFAAPATGFVFDPLVLLIGAVGLLLLCVALGALSARRSARPFGDRPRGRSLNAAPTSGLARWHPRAGAIPSALVGTRRALQRGTGRARLPIGTALLGSTIAVTALVATTVFGASLSNLARTPSLYGQAWQLELTPSTRPQLRSILQRVESDGAVDRITEAVLPPSIFTIRGINVPVVLIEDVKGPLTFPVVGGDLPDTDQQIALGSSTLRQLGAHIGSIVPLTTLTPFHGVHTAPFEVVGTTSFAPTWGSGGLGTGVLLTVDGAKEAVCGSSATCRATLAHKLAGSQVYVLIAEAPGPSGEAAVASLAHRYGSLVQLPVTPNDLVDFGQAVNFPLLLAIALSLFGAATFTHLLVVSVTRRRRDVALMKALGFVRRQIGAAVCWQATTVALLAIAFGVPVGIAVGRLLWRAFAVNLGAVSVESVAGWYVVALAGAVLVAANLLALLPAVSAARLRPSEALRQQ